MDEPLTTMAQTLGHEFADETLLQQALTHASYKNEVQADTDDYERLEFLGDAVFELATSELLFERFPSAREGRLTQLRARLVNATTLARLAEDLGVAEALRMGRGEERTGGRSRRSILSDGVEAVIGAVYLDGGYIAARDVVRRLFAGRLDALLADGTVKDPKSKLQEWAQERFHVTPRYTIVETSGPQHASEFVAEVSLEPHGRARGTGPSKKAAEQQAAVAAWVALVDTPATEASNE